MADGFIPHEMKIQKTLILLLALFPFGILVNGFGTTMSIKDAKTDMNIEYWEINQGRFWLQKMWP